MPTDEVREGDEQVKVASSVQEGAAAMVDLTDDLERILAADRVPDEGRARGRVAGGGCGRERCPEAEGRAPFRVALVRAGCTQPTPIVSSDELLEQRGDPSPPVERLVLYRADGMSLSTLQIDVQEIMEAPEVQAELLGSPGSASDDASSFDCSSTTASARGSAGSDQSSADPHAAAIYLMSVLAGGEAHLAASECGQPARCYEQDCTASAPSAPNVPRLPRLPPAPAESKPTLALPSEARMAANKPVVHGTDSAVQHHPARSLARRELDASEEPPRGCVGEPQPVARSMNPGAVVHEACNCAGVPTGGGERSSHQSRQSAKRCGSVPNFASDARASTSDDVDAGHARVSGRTDAMSFTKRNPAPASRPRWVHGATGRTASSPRWSNASQGYSGTHARPTRPGCKYASSERPADEQPGTPRAVRELRARILGRGY